MTNTVASGANNSAARNSSETLMKVQRTSVADDRIAAWTRRDVFMCRARDARHQRTLEMSRLRPHACSRLIVSRKTKEMTSMTKPSAAAPL